MVLAKPRYLHERVRRARSPALRDFFKVPLDRLVVVHDELDLPYGGSAAQARRRRQRAQRAEVVAPLARAPGTSTGSGSASAARRGAWTQPHFVLRDFSAAERKELDVHVDRAADAVEALVVDGIEKAQNTFNT